jgi:hypothetical protein
VNERVARVEALLTDFSIYREVQNSDWCFESITAGWFCSRERGHDGPHVAHGRGSGRAYYAKINGEVIKLCENQW